MKTKNIIATCYHFWIEDQNKLFIPEKNKQYSAAFIKSLLNVPCYKIKENTCDDPPHFMKFTVWENDDCTLHTAEKLKLEEIPPALKTYMLIMDLPYTQGEH